MNDLSKEKFIYIETNSVFENASSILDLEPFEYSPKMTQNATRRFEEINSNKSMTASRIQSVLNARRLRSKFFSPELFSDPAWDMILDLGAAQLTGKKIAVSSVCIASGVPATTALRWIKLLTECGIVMRTPDAKDGRRTHLELTATGFNRLLCWLSSVDLQSDLADI